MVNAPVIAIKLVQFNYRMDYEPAEGAEIKYVIDLSHRPHAETKNLDILVKVRYLAENDKKPVLQAACLTTFHAKDAKTGIDPEDGLSTMTISNALGKRLTQEAISHTRALIAVHTAATPFSTSHIGVGEVMTLEEMEQSELSADQAD